MFIASDLVEEPDHSISYITEHLYDLAWMSYRQRNFTTRKFL